MTPFRRKYEKEYAITLFNFAGLELETVKALVAHPAGRPETTCFLAQQVIEKCLKAVICHFELPVPLINDLGGLLAVLPDVAGRLEFARLV